MTTAVETAAPAAKRTPWKKLDATTRKLIEMFTENTGAQAGDSGGAYGRHWERNQGRDFLSEPEATLEAVYNPTEGQRFEALFQVSAFHYLGSRLTAAPEMNRRYQAYARSRRSEEHEMNIMESFAKEHLPAKGFDTGGIYGEGQPLVINTYNGEDSLSQTLQYVHFTVKEGWRSTTTYIILQVHGGCDVRGGYTDAVVFAADYSEGLTDNAGGSIYDGSNFWDTTNGGYSWDDNNGDKKGLDDYPVTLDPAKRGNGENIYVDENGIGYSPLTGEAFQVSGPSR